eukprot:CCRYP_005165-RH/>CCRYP_005165-RH protein AED:0.47 eAED:1.00 QI:0/-1/0/1/-1/0/1/0/74
MLLGSARPFPLLSAHPQRYHPFPKICPVSPPVGHSTMQLLWVCCFIFVVIHVQTSPSQFINALGTPFAQLAVTS